jgi:hypothetical protein
VDGWVDGRSHVSWVVCRSVCLSVCLSVRVGDGGGSGGRVREWWVGGHSARQPVCQTLKVGWVVGGLSGRLRRLDAAALYPIPYPPPPTPISNPLLSSLLPPLLLPPPLPCMLPITPAPFTHHSHHPSNNPIPLSPPPSSLAHPM